MKRCACVLFIGLILSFAAHADGGYYPGYGYPPGYSNGYTAPVYGNGGYVAYPGYGRQAYRNPYYPEGRRGWGGGGGKKGANMNGANTTAGEAAVGADATGATDRSAAGLSNRGLEAIGTEMYAKDRQDFQSGAAAPSGGSQMKSVAIITGMLLLAGCVAAPVPVRVAPPVAVIAPPGVVYARPAYPLPGLGYAWAYHPRYGWGWRHPAYGWHRGWR